MLSKTFHRRFYGHQADAGLAVVRKLLVLGAATSTLLVGAGLLSKAHAGEDVFRCAITDIRGNKLGYGFGFNSANADGSIGGTMVETAFIKNSQTITSAPGARPIWIFQQNTLGGVLLTQRSDPRWKIGTAGNSGAAELIHDGLVVGRGVCEIMQAKPDPRTAAGIADQGL